MDRRAVQRSMYELQAVSRAPRLMLAASGALWVMLAWWLLFGAGLQIFGHWFGRAWTPGDAMRRACLAIGLTIYYIRVLFTAFVFLRRGMGWSEAFTIAPWMLLMYLLIGITGGTNAEPFSAVGYIGVVLFLAGSWMNSYAEFTRHVWKQRPENSGRLYTEGLFRYSRHPNYFGDLVLFLGLCLISGAWITALVPLLMLALFTFVNVPILDSHLRDHYGPAFDAYAKRTPKLLPFLY
ncbi:MAG TPA: DUF1295 domain-containing protein [Bryobacteraceae bacterium]|nr:DUF1295 domain-containing protein [Bryobacteraceae bacterium]